MKISEAKILLDPGHGGADSGHHCAEAVEKRIVLRVAVHVKRLLEAQLATVFLTRDSDYTLSDEKRQEISYILKPDCLVSIHCNANDNKKAKGLEITGQALAETIGATATTYIPGIAFMVNPGTTPECIVNLGYLSNIEDRDYLLTTEGQFAFAKIIASGIYRYLKALT